MSNSSKQPVDPGCSGDTGSSRNRNLDGGLDNVVFNVLNSQNQDPDNSGNQLPLQNPVASFAMRNSGKQPMEPGCSRDARSSQNWNLDGGLNDVVFNVLNSQNQEPDNSGNQLPLQNPVASFAMRNSGKQPMELGCSRDAGSSQNWNLDGGLDDGVFNVLNSQNQDPDNSGSQLPLQNPVASFTMRNNSKQPMEPGCSRDAGSSQNWNLDGGRGDGKLNVDYYNLNSGNQLPLQNPGDVGFIDVNSQNQLLLHDPDNSGNQLPLQNPVGQLLSGELPGGIDWISSPEDPLWQMLTAAQRRIISNRFYRKRKQEEIKEYKTEGVNIKYWKEIMQRLICQVANLNTEKQREVASIKKLEEEIESIHRHIRKLNTEKQLLCSQLASLHGEFETEKKQRDKLEAEKKQTGSLIESLLENQQQFQSIINVFQTEIEQIKSKAERAKIARQQYTFVFKLKFCNGVFDTRAIAVVRDLQGITQSKMTADTLTLIGNVDPQVVQDKLKAVCNVELFAYHIDTVYSFLSTYFHIIWIKKVMMKQQLWHLSSLESWW